MHQGLHSKNGGGLTSYQSWARQMLVGLVTCGSRDPPSRTVRADGGACATKQSNDTIAESTRQQAKLIMPGKRRHISSHHSLSLSLTTLLCLKAQAGVRGMHQGPHNKHGARLTPCQSWARPMLVGLVTCSREPPSRTIQADGGACATKQSNDTIAERTRQQGAHYAQRDTTSLLIIPTHHPALSQGTSDVRESCTKGATSTPAVSHHSRAGLGRCWSD